LDVQPAFAKKETRPNTIPMIVPMCNLLIDRTDAGGAGAFVWAEVLIVDRADVVVEVNIVDLGREKKS
jgi:hypothetical protein